MLTEKSLKKQLFKKYILYIYESIKQEKAMVASQDDLTVKSVRARQLFKVEPIGYEQVKRAQSITMGAEDQKLAATGFRFTFGNNVGLGKFGENATGIISGLRQYDSDGNPYQNGQRLNFIS
jgi:hypothetical protein